MVAGLAEVCQTGLFCGRNIEATSQGHVGKAAVVVGQARNLAGHVATLDNKIGKATKSALEAFKKIAQNDKVVDGVGKVVDLAGKYVNPLICVSAGIDVITSDDKESALVTNATALASMFTVEHLMKQHLDKVPKIKGIDKIAGKVMEVAKECKCEGKLPSIIRGVAFVVGSCVSYDIGHKFGNLLLGKNVNSK